MKVTMHMLDGSTLDWQDMPGESVMGLTDALMHDISAPAFVQLTMGGATVLVNTAQIVRIDIEDSAA